MVVMDLFGSRVDVVLDDLPCIAASRGSAGGFGLSSYMRFTSIHELMPFQGLPPCRYDFVILSNRPIGHTIGNGISVNVAARIFGEIFKTLGLRTRWRWFPIYCCTRFGRWCAWWLDVFNASRNLRWALRGGDHHHCDVCWLACCWIKSLLLDTHCRLEAHEMSCCFLAVICFLSWVLKCSFEVGPLLIIMRRIKMRGVLKVLSIDMGMYVFHENLRMCLRLAFTVFNPLGIFSFLSLDVFTTYQFDICVGLLFWSMLLPSF